MKSKDVILHIVGIIATAVILYVLQITGTMQKVMGIVLLILAVLQILDWKAFVKAFSMYDDLAKHSKPYAYFYSPLLAALGLAYIYNYQLQTAAIITIIIFGVGAIGVLKQLGTKIKCACLGLIKIPLSKFTFYEDLAMVAMGIMLLL